MTTSPELGSEAARADASAVSALAGTRGALVFAGLFLAVLMGSMDSLVVSTVLPTIAADLDDASGITFVVSAYLIATTIAIPIFAKLADTTGRRNVFLVGITIFIVGSALAGVSQNLPELIAFRAIQGFGGGAVFPVAIALIAVLYPPGTRARLTGLLSAAAGIAIVAGPLLGSYIVSITTWRWVFYINLPIGIAAAVILLVAIAEVRPTTRERFDTVGTLTLSGWVGALMLALVLVADSGYAWTNPAVLGLLTASILLCAGFVLWELRVPNPVIPLRLFRQRVIAASSGVMFANGIILTALITFLSVFVGIVLLDSVDSVRDIIYFFAVPLILGASASGWVLAKVSYRNLIAPSLALAGVAGLFLTTLTPSTPLWTLAFGFLPIGGLALPLILVGLGSGLALSGTTIAVQHEARSSEVGQAVGLTRFLQSLGGAIGLSLLTIFQSWRAGVLSAGATDPSEVLAATVNSYNEVFLILAILLLVSVLFALLFQGRIPNEPLAHSKPSVPPPPGSDGSTQHALATGSEGDPIPGIAP